MRIKREQTMVSAVASAKAENLLLARGAMFPAMLAALREAEAGLLFAGAGKKVGKNAFVPAPVMALRIVRQAIADATAAERPPATIDTRPAAPGKDEEDETH